MASENTLVWRIGEFLTGELDAGYLPVARGGKVNVNITSTGTADLTVALSELSATARNGWKSYFTPIKRFVALIDTSLPWTSKGAIVYAGFINKVSSKVRSGQITLQAIEMNEYLKTRLIIDASGKVEDPTSALVFSGATWADVQKALAKRAFSAAGLAPNSPKPPKCVTIPAPKSGSKSKKVLRTDAKTYYDALTEVQEQDSPNGQEWVWVPQFTSASKSKVRWHFITGNPKVREKSITNLTLDEGSAKFSDYQTTFDSRDLYTRMWIQSKRGDEAGKKGADLTPGAITASKFPILVERFYNPGVELDSDQLQEQLTAHLKYAGVVEHEAGFSIEEAWNPAQWIHRIGRTIKITGINNTLSAGHTGTFRLMGLSFTPGQGTVSLDVVPPADKYPRLPKKSLADAIGKTNALGSNSTSLNLGNIGGGGGSVPEIPWNPGTGDPGEGGAGWDWGSGGGAPGEVPGDYSNAEWEVGEPAPTSPGERSFTDVTQNEGNILFYVEDNGLISRNDTTTPPSEYWGQLFRYHDGGFITIGSAYVSNGEIEGAGLRQTAYLSAANLTALINAGRSRDVFYKPMKASSSNTDYDYAHVRTTLTLGKLISVAGRVIIPVHIAIGWRELKKSRSTGAVSWPSGSVSITWQYGVAFLSATYTQYDNISPFTPDLASFLQMTGVPSKGVRSGTWVAFSDGTTTKAANFVSGGNALNTWWNFPPNTFSMTGGEMAVGKLKDGTRVLAMGRTFIPILNTLIPAADATWQEFSEVPMAFGYNHPHPFTHKGLLFYIVGEAGSGSGNSRFSIRASSGGLTFTKISGDLDNLYNAANNRSALSFENYIYVPRTSKGIRSVRLAPAS